MQVSSPGVYIDEIEISTRPIEGVSTSTAGFLGITERGPTALRFVSSFDQFQRIYGDFIEDGYLAYSIDGFFRNGGQRCFVGRVVKQNATESETTINGTRFKAKELGQWGDRIAIRIENAAINDPDKRFKLIIAYWKKTDFPSNFNGGDNPTETVKKLLDLARVRGRIEEFNNLSIEESDPNYFLTKINDSSNLVVVSVSEPATRPTNNDSDHLFQPLTGGSDGDTLQASSFTGDATAGPGQRTGLVAFEGIDEISLITVPDIHWLDDNAKNELIGQMIVHCEALKDRFVVVEGPKVPTTNILDLKGNIDNKYVATYSPWIKVFDPLSNKPKPVPPGGHIVGIYARSDQQRGVHKAPANEIVRGALELEFNITKRDQDTLNPIGVNVIRSFPGRGILVWGARTTATNPLWKYINVRRLFNFLEESIEEGTQWVVFEPNDEKLWARVKLSITEFLTRVWRDGALMGSKPEEAFFVKIDRTTMTQNDIDNGKLIALIGIAPVKPAEFVIFRIAQVPSGSEISEA
ncbi:phage tail sheath family protein [Brevibacillus sp. SYSU BS000544]|uniref:phage tail sheath family protein n=1 Tax=Brevibacillus sp. SYSU BS000544 TaxID=3416443 RepID=UPI003CE540DD